MVMNREERLIRSERISQTLRVLRMVKDGVIDMTDPYTGESMDRENFNAMVTDKVEEVASELSITVGTCFNKMTREIGIATQKQFKEELWKFFTDNKAVEDTSLANKIIANVTFKDDVTAVRNSLHSVKNH